MVVAWYAAAKMLVSGILLRLRVPLQSENRGAFVAGLSPLSDPARRVPCGASNEERAPHGRKRKISAVITLVPDGECTVRKGGNKAASFRDYPTRIGSGCELMTVPARMGNT